MERFTAINLLGEGTSGRVWKAVHKDTNEIVAIKQLKRQFHSWNECMSLREVRILSKLKHPNIVSLKEVTLQSQKLYLIFEYMEGTLYDVLKARLISEREIRNFCYQVFHALAYVHQSGYFHRDLKPENLLVTGDVIKLADFGLARELLSRPPYTTYMTTRSYRAPELMLKSSRYNSAIDMWSMGAIMAELFSLQPLFLGLTEFDQLYRICTVIGSPNSSNWSEGLSLAASMNIGFPPVPAGNLSKLIPRASPEAIDLIASLCVWDPNKRPTALQAVEHPFFRPKIRIPLSISVRTGSTQHNTFKTCLPNVTETDRSQKQMDDEQYRGVDKRISRPNQLTAAEEWRICIPCLPNTSQKHIEEEKNRGEKCVSKSSQLPASEEWNVCVPRLPNIKASQKEIHEDKNRVGKRNSKPNQLPTSEEWSACIYGPDW